LIIVIDKRRMILGEYADMDLDGDDPMTWEEPDEPPPVSLPRRAGKVIVWGILSVVRRALAVLRLTRTR